MALTIALAGKGGSGKTTIAALLVRLGKDNPLRAPLLAIDADPNSILGEQLEIDVPEDDTIASLREDSSNPQKKMPAGIAKAQYVESELQRRVIEAQGFDLLTMGRPEGPRCYCSVNNLLRQFLGRLRRAYRTLIIDNEAGMEHLSRQTTDDVDHLILVSEASVSGLKSAVRIQALANSLPLKIKKYHLIINKVPAEGLSPECRNIKAAIKSDSVLELPFSEEVARLSSHGKSIFQIDDQSPVVTTLRSWFGSLNS